MIGAIPLSQYATELAFLNDRYDLLLSDFSAKEAYKKANNYKIAWNWANARSEFYPRYARRIERNRNQAIYRLTRKYDLSFLLDLAKGVTDDFSAVQTLAFGPYWNIGGSFIVDWVDRTEARGITVVLGTYDAEDETQRTYRDSMRRELAIRELIRRAGKWQKEDGDSGRPTVLFASGIVKNVPDLVYFNVIVER